MLRKLDDVLNKITMYKLVLWCLRILMGIAIIFSSLGIIGIKPFGLIIALAILSAVSYTSNVLFARIWRVPANTESYAITLLILFFIMPPASTVERALYLVLAAVLAVASKFIIAYRGRHIFNPAAFAPALLGLFGLTYASWWVGSGALWPFTLIIGLLVVRKIRRFALFLAFAVTSLLVTVLTANGRPLIETLQFAVTATPLLFLGTIMLTEPATMPARRQEQIIFGILVGLLYALPLKVGPFTILPETALVLGNMYAFAVNPKYRLRLKLAEIQPVSDKSDRVANYVFTPDRPARYQPGQYMEFTLDHPRHDSRGNRRTFSIASSPSEPNIQIGVKYYTPSSSFKTALRNMKIGDEMFAGSLAGDFTLPANPREKLVFTAGGIGITPFRSMLKYLVDRQEKRDIILIYAVSDPSEIAYKDILETAAAQGVRVIPILTSGPAEGWTGRTGKLTPELLDELIPDHQERTFYLSGPQPMIESLKDTVKKLDAKKIKTDYFTGY